MESSDPDFIRDIEGSYISHNLSDFPVANEISTCFSLDFSSNPITNFENLPVLPLLETLIMDNTKIESFINVWRQPSLTSLSFKGTPLSKYPLSRIMAIISFGYWLKEVNGVSVSNEELKIAQKLGPRLRPLLVSGWILTSLDPPHVLHYKTKVTGLMNDFVGFIQNSKKEEKSKTKNNKLKYDPYLSSYKSNELLSEKSCKKEKEINNKEEDIENGETTSNLNSKYNLEDSVTKFEKRGNEHKKHHKRNKKDNKNKNEDLCIISDTSSYIDIDTFDSFSSSEQKKSITSCASTFMPAIINDMDSNQSFAVSYGSEEDEVIKNALPDDEIREQKDEKEVQKSTKLSLQNPVITNVFNDNSSIVGNDSVDVNLSLSNVISLQSPLVEKDKQKAIFDISEVACVSFDKQSHSSQKEEKSNTADANSSNESPESSFIGLVSEDMISNIPLSSMSDEYLSLSALNSNDKLYELATQLSEESLDEQPIVCKNSVKAPMLPVPNIDPMLKEAKKQAEEKEKILLNPQSDVKSVESIPPFSDYSRISPRSKRGAKKNKTLPTEEVGSSPLVSQEVDVLKKTIINPPPLPLPHPHSRLTIEKCCVEIQNKHKKKTSETQIPHSEHRHHHHHRSNHSASKVDNEPSTIDSSVGEEVKHKRHHKTPENGKKKYESSNFSYTPQSKFHESPVSSNTEPKTIESHSHKRHEKSSNSLQIKNNIKRKSNHIRKYPLTLDPDDNKSIEILRSDLYDHNKSNRHSSPMNAKVDTPRPKDRIVVNVDDLLLPTKGDSPNLKRRPLYQPRKREAQKRLYPNLSQIA